jgi:hypothetical protein
VDDFLFLFNPFAAGQDGNLLVEKDRVLAAYCQTRARFPDRLPLPAFPEPGGVLPVGRTDNGDELYWVTEGQPDGWPVVLVAARAALQEVHPMSVTGFLAALAANQLTSRVLPQDLLRAPATDSPHSPLRDRCRLGLCHPVQRSVIVAMTATKGLLGEYRMLPLADLGESSDARPAVGP